MPITMSDEDFEFIYEALRRVNTPYDHEDVPGIVRQERQAWERCEKIAAEHGRDLPGIPMVTHRADLREQRPS